MKTYTFTPFDTLFFRDGRPFNQGETSLFGVPSQFPPAPPTIVGALRAALARGQGWAYGPWGANLTAVLGDGQNLADLTFAGPYLLRDEALLLPAPAHLLGQPDKSGQGKWQGLTRLRPGPERDCDLGARVRLPIAQQPAEGLKDLSGCWLTWAGMATVLAGGVPSPQQIIESSQLWRQEQRTGIGRNPATKTANDGELYTCSHVRPVDESIKLALRIKGLPEGWEPDAVTPLGGENRMAWVDLYPKEVSLPPCPKVPVHYGKVRYTVTLVTPADIETWPGPGEPLHNLPGAVVCACQQRAQRIGGWDTEKRGPLPLTPLVPVGSTWFMEADGDEAVAILAQLHGSHIGNRTEWGFGQIVIGIWKKEK